MASEYTKEKTSNLTNLYTIWLSAYYFLLIVFPQFDMFLIITTIVINIMYLIFNSRVAIKTNMFQNVFFIFIFWVAIGLFYTTEITYGHLRFILFLVAAYLSIVNLVFLENWEKSLFKYMVIGNSILLSSGILQILSSPILNRINQIHLTSEHYFSYLSYQTKNIIVGFTQNPAVIAFSISIVLFYLFIKIIYERNQLSKIIYVILFIIAYYLLFSTGKRIFLLISIIGLCYLILRIFGDNLQSKIKAIFLLIIIVLVFILFLFYTEIGQLLLLRTIDADDISTGRFDIYTILWKDFLDSPIIGNGTYSTKDVITLNNGHNIYIQVLRENGIIGMIPLLIMLIGNLFVTDKLIRNSKSDDDKVLLAMSISVQFLFILWGLTGNPLYDNYPLVAYIVFSCIPWKIRNSI